MMFGAWGYTDHDDCLRITHARARRRHQLHRYRRRVRCRRVGGDLGQSAAGAPRRRRPGHQMPSGHGSDPNHQGSSRRWIMRAVRRQPATPRHRLHRPLPDPPAQAGCDHDETLGALTDLVRAGKVRYLGTSTYPAVGDRGGAVGGGATRPRALHLRAAAVLAARTAVSSATCCQPVSATAWASSPGAAGGGWLSGRWRKGAMEMESGRANGCRRATTCATRPANQVEL